MGRFREERKSSSVVKKGCVEREGLVEEERHMVPRADEIGDGTKC